MTVLVAFVVAYIGMIFGGFRGLALDRTGIVLLAAIVVVASGAITTDEAVASIDVPTICLLFGLMILSAQFRLGGFYTLVARRLQSSRHSAPAYLASVMGVAAGLSALLANDIICLALTPVVIEICAARRFNPLPQLLGLACGANIGSAATLIGNPQNMLIGEVLQLSFAGYLLRAIVPSAVGLLVAWGIIAWQFRARWQRDFSVPPAEMPAFDAWQTGKGLVVLVALVAVFLGGWVPRELAALAAAGVLLLSRRMASPRFLSLVDWNLLLLFIGLFILNHALDASGWMGRGLTALRGAGIDPDHGGWLFGLAVVLSNLVSNVPAVMLLLPAGNHPDAGLILALASTFAGNLILVGSIANIIVAEQAARMGVAFTARDHARTGIPVTLATLAVAAVWILVLKG